MKLSASLVYVENLLLTLFLVKEPFKLGDAFVYPLNYIFDFLFTGIQDRVNLSCAFQCACLIFNV